MKLLESYIAAVIEAYLLEDFTDSTVSQRSQEPNAQAEGFNLHHLMNIKELPQVQGYVQRNLGNARIGEGSGRYVYRLGNSQVLKVAKNLGGQGQNQAEATVCSAEGSSDLFPKVFQVGPQAMWLIAQEAQPMTRTKFTQLTGMTWGEFMSALGGAFPEKVSKSSLSSGEIQQSRNNFDKHYGNAFFRKIINAIKECKYEPGDIAKLDSWGVVDGRPVIIDSGFTEAVNQTHYQGKQ